MPSIKRDCKGVLIRKILSQIDVIYTLSDYLTSSDVASMKNQGDDDGGLSVDSDDHEDQPADDITLKFHYLQDSGHRGTSVLEAT